jgi:hypothetical protein
MAIFFVKLKVTVISYLSFANKSRLIISSRSSPARGLFYKFYLSNFRTGSRNNRTVSDKANKKATKYE